MSRRWYERFPGTFDKEIAAYEEKGLAFNVNEALLQKGKVVFEGAVKVSDDEHQLRVVYPPMFPDVKVEVIDLSRQYIRHQNPWERNLCLPEWDRSQTGADKVLEAINLISILEQEPGEIAKHEAPIPEPESTWFHYTPRCCSLLPQELAELPSGGHGGFKLIPRIYKIDDGAYVHFILTEVSRQGEPTETFSPGSLADDLPFDGTWTKVQNVPPRDLLTYDDWRSWACKASNKLEYWLDRQRKSQSAAKNGIITEAFAVVYPEERSYQVYSNQWQICIRQTGGGGKQDFILRPHILPKGDDQFQRIPSLKGLQNKRVVIIGLGTLGSRLAEDLARAGVSRFVLIDYDDIRPGNIVRHSADLRTVGLSKTCDSMLRIKSINPRAEIVIINRRIGAASLKPEEDDIDDLDILDTEFGSSDLVISTICDPPVDYWIDEIARDNRVPAVFAGVYYGAWGGQVFRSVIGAACYQCFMWSDKRAKVQIPSDTPLLYLDGCGDPSFPGAGFDTSIIANLATRLSVQTLLKGDGYPDAPYNLISWSSRGEHAGEFPNVRVETVEHDHRCKKCKQESINAE